MPRDIETYDLTMSHFDDRAATWDDDPTHTQRAAAIVAALRTHVSLTPQTTVLEVGAGTGAIGRSLAPDVQSVTLLDASAGMTDVARQRIEAGLLNVTAVHGELDTPLGQRYDLIVGSLMLHHVDDIPGALVRLADLLAEGGTLAIADLDEDVTREFHDEGFAGHHGFSREILGADLAAASLTDLRWSTAFEMPKTTASGHTRIFPVFLVTASATHKAVGDP